MNRAQRYLLAGLSLLLVTACSNQPDREIMQGTSPVQLRAYQTREFATADKLSMLRSVVATLQDLGFIIDEANVDLGSITGTKMSGAHIRITVVVRRRGNDQLLVRASAYYDLTSIEDPEPYQDFFTSLEKAVFLTAHQVD